MLLYRLTGFQRTLIITIRLKKCSFFFVRVRFKIGSCIVKEQTSQDDVRNGREVEIIKDTCQPELGLYFKDDDQDIYTGRTSEKTNIDTADFSFLGFNFDGGDEKVIIECTVNICLNFDCIQTCSVN